MPKKTSPRNTAPKRIRAPKRACLGGTGVITPRGMEARYGWSPPTRWRAERDGRLPPRDVFIGGKAVGWRPETIERAERGIAPVDAGQPRPPHRTLQAVATCDAAPDGLPIAADPRATPR
jgi:predicted DNA-binding transcriptional regulator AlpA